MERPLCCVDLNPYHPRLLDHEEQFSAFMTWAKHKCESPEPVTGDSPHPSVEDKPYAVQLVRQVNFGPLETKRYFVPSKDQSEQSYLEISEKDLANANF